MQKEEYWEKFLMSGKVADYLGYCRSDEQKMHSSEGEGALNACMDKEPDDKRKHNAGFY